MTEYTTVKSFVDNETFVVPRWLPPEKIENCTLLSDRDSLIELLPKHGVVAEVGTFRGEFARTILDTAQPRELHVFDITFDNFERSLFEAELASGRVTLHEGDSSAELAKLRGAPRFDWIYIDGDHSYEGVRNDIEQAKHLIKPDGILAFNDYAVYSPLERWQYGVMRAVNDLILDDDFELIYFALAVLGYYDVAVRRAS